MIQVIAVKADGTLVGEDENGRLHVGVHTEVSATEVERVVLDDSGGRVRWQDRYHGEVILSADVEADNYDDTPPFEGATRHVIDWTEV